MLSSNKANNPINAVLRYDMVIAGERCEKGEVVEMSARDFVYLSSHERVLEANKENVEAVRAEIKAAKANERPSELEHLRAENARLQAELEKKTK